MMILFTIVLIAVFHPISLDMYTPAFPQIIEQLNTNISLVQLSMTSFIAGLVIFQLVTGILSDRLGRKKVLVAGLAFYIVFSLACSLASDVTSLILFRFFQALGAGTTAVLSRAIVKDLYGEREVSSILGYVAAIASLMILVSPLIGGLITTALGWRFVFGLQLAMGALALILVCVYIDGDKANHLTSTSIKQLTKDFIGYAKQKSVLAYALPASTNTAGIYSFMTGGSIILIKYYHMDVKLYGVFYALAILGYILGNFILAKKSKKYGNELFMQISVILALISGLIMATGVMLFIGLGSYIIIVSMFIFMLSSGFIFPSSSAQSMALYPNSPGSLAALMGTAKMLVAMLVTLLLSLFNSHSPMPFAFIMFAMGLLSFIFYHYFKYNKPEKNN